MRLAARLALLLAIGEIDDLASDDPAVRAQALAALRVAGHASVERVLDRFAAAPPLARELRARLIHDVGDAGDVDRVAPLLNDPSPLVRAELAAFLGRPDLGVARATSRAGLLFPLLRDADESLATVATQGLLRLADRSLVPDLVALVREGSASQREAAIRILGATPGSAPALLDLADAIQTRAPAQRATWLLMLGFTGDPAVVPMLVRYASDPADGIAARVGFDALVQQLWIRQRESELAGALRAWREIDAADAIEREVRYQLLIQGDTAAARVAAAELDRRAALEGARGYENRALAKTIGAVAHLVEGHGREAEDSLAEAVAWIEAARGVAGDGDESVALLITHARVLSLSALNALLNKFEGAPSPERRLAQAYALHVARIRLSAYRSIDRILRDPDTVQQVVFGRGVLTLTAPWNFDQVLEGDFGPTRLLMFMLPKRGRGAEGLAAGTRALEILADLNPHEFVAPGRGDDYLKRPDPVGVFGIQTNFGAIEVHLTMPLSNMPRDLGLLARGTLGNLERAAVLLEPVIQRAILGRQATDLRTFVEASLERAGVAMDAQQGDVAEATCDAALAHLDRIRSTHENDYDPALVKELGERPEARTADARYWLDLERQLRSDTLVSKAVNENVVRGKPKVASGFAKKGVELNPTEFNRVLLACYLAREGNAADSRAILRDAVERPSTFYNLACTYALLGEKETALRYLERDLREVRTDAGGLERQRAWARKDPDLRSLRDDARFQELVGAAASKPSSAPAAGGPRR